uniref:Cytochrome c oxidase subunit 3 n=1 Tax=Encyrtus eulecaniumiae TaxID=1914888 RepID=A0A7S5KLV6_9HYME|nr:cytochrome c oxidase subunit III [Encyrtus eulecaniumiae]QGA74464.1 cytochrome c oxidase subunit III [Encyrtus eulecaniumiae]QGA74477.1 cytochrome c oxidase subunit III [Encyrtus eulecaniumiae]QGA74490.1 cytochrome c oxidase subunit III [Encyrtus eulecaniumiae]
MKMKLKLFQPFHLVTISPWPIISSFSIFSILVGVVNWFYKMSFSFALSIFFMLVCLSLFQWWRDVVRESFFQGFHTFNVVKGLKLGMILFIISEVFFFISIFWCYLHMFLSPSIEIGAFWPPDNLEPFDPYFVPLLNTLILLSSGVSITWSHYSLLKGDKTLSCVSLLVTIILALIFSFFQYKEYSECSFTFCDSVYGAIFFMSTGFHGLHVLIGTLFLIIMLVRIMMDNFSKIHHFGFEAAAWYWHFVDVVWLFLYLLVYFWSV